MSQIAQQIITPTFVDDEKVIETFVNGPISVNINGPIATIIFTVVRGDFEEAMKGQQATKMTAKPASRLAMPIHVALQIRDLLNQIIVEQPVLPGTIAPGSNRTQ